MKIYSYVVARDYGFAPNPFYGYCTLATCKPVIRRTATVGDWIVGVGSARYGLQDRLVYVMMVTEAMTFNMYWADPRFVEKRPNLRGSFKQNFGDNVYHREGRRWVQVDCHHSLPSGRRNMANVRNDTQTDRILISNDFTYWGGSGPKIPVRFHSTEVNICAGRGHRSNFSNEAVERMDTWLRSMSGNGCVGLPYEFRNKKRLITRQKGN